MKDQSVLCLTAHTVYDLRRQEDRDARFDKLLEQSELPMEEFQPGCYIAIHCLPFHYLSRLEGIRRALLRAMRYGIFDWVLDISMVLSVNRLIWRFLFKSTRIDI